MKIKINGWNTGYEHKIQAIKSLRGITGFGLKESKQVTDNVAKPFIIEVDEFQKDELQEKGFIFDVIVHDEMDAKSHIKTAMEILLESGDVDTLELLIPAYKNLKRWEE
jgi:hypothetical protein